MPRIKRGKTTRKRHKKLFKATKGYRGLRRKSVRKAKEALLKAGAYAYRDRKVRKREFRKLWNIRINAALARKGIRYSEFMGKLNKKSIELNRKMLSELAVRFPEIFDQVADQINQSKAQ